MTLAFCSIAYEFLLAQALAAFLDNTVLRYSVTIGLYMFAMGFGAMFAEGRLVKRPLRTLLYVEIALTVIGASVMFLLFSFEIWQWGRAMMMVAGHTLIVLIGVLSGLEIPLLMHLSGDEGPDDTKILAFDYFGAFLGTICFAFLFYPRLGLVPTAFFVSLCNAVIGLVLLSVFGEDKERYSMMKTTFCVMTVILVIALWQANFINEQLIGMYIRAYE